MEILEKKYKLQICKINKSYNRDVLKDVSIDVYEGEFLTILGPSGCGKTTLMRIIVGLIQPTSGKIFVDGMDITSKQASERNIGIVFQNFALFENMTVKQNIEYALKVKKIDKNEINKISTNLLEKIGLSEYALKKPYSLSGGQQQRVAIARTLALNPKIILFDEPMSSLDVDTRLSLRKELKNIQKEFGTTMIYITHDQEEAFALSDRIIVMSNQGINQIGTPTEILDNPSDSFVQKFVVENLKIKVESLMKYFR